MLDKLRIEVVCHRDLDDEYGAWYEDYHHMWQIREDDDTAITMLLHVLSNHKISSLELPHLGFAPRVSGKFHEILPDMELVVQTIAEESDEESDAFA